MAKRKGRFEGQVKAISPLALDICVARLQDLKNENFYVEFKRVHQDVIAFEASILERGILRATGIGTLRRWEGTLTRVDCDVKVHEGIMRWLLALGGLSFVSMLGIPLLFFIAAQVNVIPWIAIMIGFIAVFAAMLRVVTHYAPIDDTPQNLYQLIISILEV